MYRIGTLLLTIIGLSACEKMVDGPEDLIGRRWVVEVCTSCPQLTTTVKDTFTFLNWTDMQHTVIRNDTFYNGNWWVEKETQTLVFDTDFYDRRYYYQVNDGQLKLTNVYTNSDSTRQVLELSALEL